MALDGDLILKCFLGGGIGSFALKKAIDALLERKAANSAYLQEKEAHDTTIKRTDAEIAEYKADLTTERTLRKAAEMALREAEREHANDRTQWRKEQDEWGKERDEMRSKIWMLERRVDSLTSAVAQQGTNGTN